jgi:excinuclease ABC subunit C
MGTGVFERHTDRQWKAQAHELLSQSALVDTDKSHLLGDSRDAFRPKTSDIPTNPGVYKWRDGNGRVIYVGKAKNLRNRLSNYFQPLSRLHPRTQTMVLTARSLEWTVVGTEIEALTLEYTWIKEFDPRFNVVFRDDKTYPYLAVSVGEEIPCIWVTRNKSKKNTRYYGPYTRVYDMRQSLDALLKVFPVRTCSAETLHRAQLRNRPCLLASIGKCSAPCVQKISYDDHRTMMSDLVGVLTGSSGEKYCKELAAKMKAASDDLDFEKAAQLRDQITMLNNINQQNALVFSDKVDADVFGLSSDELEASVHAFFVRSGTIRGERSWSVERVEDITDSELLSELISQVYSDIISDDDFESSTTEHESSSAVSISRKRDAVSKTQSITAATSLDRAKATRSRKAREQETGRDDLFSQASPIPKEIIVPLEPADRAHLEEWLSDARGSKVEIRVAQRGEKKDLVERASANADLARKQNKLKRGADLESRSRALNDLADALGLHEAPLRIEGFDISNASGGGFQVASMVVFEDGMSKKSEYRRFSIKGPDGNGAIDDVSAIYETLTRRFKHGNIAGDSGQSIESEKEIEKAERAGDVQSVEIGSDPTSVDPDQIVQQNTDLHHFAYKPNLIVVDGGKPQVESAARALADCGVTDVALCGLAKRLEEVWLAGEDYPIILKRQSDAMYLLQRVRDESHRFAITFHRQKRRKGEIYSILDSVPGIGETYQKALLKHFSSVRAMKAASVEQLQEVPGIGAAKAEALYRALHPAKKNLGIN